MKGINDLPAQDLYPIIFSNLSIEDLFSCRLVNKQFKYFSDNTNGINKLIIGQPIEGNDGFYWIYNNKLINDNDIISLECFEQIRSLSIFNLVRNLKYLKIYDEQFRFEELSKLINLESIEYGLDYISDYYTEQIINLSNLKVFAYDNLSIQLNTPKLEIIKSDIINEIELDNTESIKHLITSYYKNELEIFKNLEIMELKSNHLPINENALIIFKNLKQLKFNENCILHSDLRFKNCLFKILNDKIKLSREIDIYLEGIKIENIDKFDELTAIKNSHWKFRLNNYDLLDLNVSFINQLRYEELEECVNNIENDLPSTFFDKFQNIIYVEVNKVEDVDGFNWFLNNLKYIKKLKIRPKVSLNEIFYNNLPNTIKYLTISNKEDINYDFILKLSKLIEFHTKVDKDLFDMALASFSNLKYLNCFDFYFKRNRIEIEKNGKYFYLNNEELNYNQLIVECIIEKNYLMNN